MLKMPKLNGVLKKLESLKLIQSQNNVEPELTFFDMLNYLESDVSAELIIVENLALLFKEQAGLTLE